MKSFRIFIKEKFNNDLWQETIEVGNFQGTKIPDVKTLARVSHKFVYHSGTKDQLNHLKDYLEPHHGDWIKEVASGLAVDDHEHYLENHATPLVWMSDKPDWVHMKVARKLNKPRSDVSDDDIKNHGHVALIPKKGDNSHHIWKIGKEGLYSHSKITNLKGEQRKAEETELYDHDSQKGPFGVERNEYVSAKPVEPMFHLTGQHLLDFLKHTKDST